MPSDGKTPGSYTEADGWDDKYGVDKCPHCNEPHWGSVSPEGTIYDKHGRKYDNIFNTDTSDGPFFCPDCWRELEANRKADENQSLGEFA